MRSPISRALIVSTFLLTAVAAPAGAGGGDVFVGTTYYPTSSASILAMPASGTVYLPTSYAYSSYSYSPTTVYSDTSMLSTTAYYVPTSTYAYRSRYVTPRRAARMGMYSPTTYYEYSPTTFYSTPLVTTSATLASCDSSAPPMAIPTSTSPSGSMASPSGVKPPIKSTPLPPPAAPPVDKPQTPEPDLLGKPPAEPQTPVSAPPKDPVPAAPAPAADPISPPPSEVKPPGDLGASAADKEKRYLSLKPKPGELTLAPTRPPALIRGRVTSGISGAAIPKAKVVLTNARFANPRSYTADDLGSFEVPFLPDGDWTLAVEDKDGKALDFGVLTVSSGRVYDADGRVWTSFNLSR